MSLKGLYIIQPKNGSDKEVLLIGPVPLIFPPPNVPVRVGGDFIEKWVLIPTENNTYNVFAGNAKPNDYKWFRNANDLFVTATAPPDSFRFEPAGEDVYTIGIFAENLLLTYHPTASPESPPLSFRPADGSDAQRFRLTRIDRD